MKEKVITGIRFLLGLMMVNAGLNKFLHYMPMPEMTEQAMELMGAFGASGYMFPLIAITEIVAGILLLTKKYNALGAVLMMPITVNIFLFHAFLDTAGMGMGIVLLAINIVILVSERKRLFPMCGCYANCG
jgi:putative oxidoreductase